MIADVPGGGMIQAGSTPTGTAGCSAIVLAVLLPIIAGFLPGCYRTVIKNVEIDRLNAEAKKLGGSAGNAGDASDIFLDLTGTGIGDEGFARLARMDGFKWVGILSLADTRITDASSERLADHPTLGMIDLSRTNITDKSMPYLITFKYVFSVRLAGTGITDAGLEALKAIPEVSPYQSGSIDLTDTKVTEAGVQNLVKNWKGSRTNIVYGTSQAPKQLR